MQVVKQYPDGVFSWVDLGTSDTEGAKAFFDEWDISDEPGEVAIVLEGDVGLVPTP